MDKRLFFFELASNLYGEELVDLQDSSVLILYPKVVITNSRYGNKHLIRDLVVRFNASEDTIGYPCASRLSLTIKEYKARYIHSHVSSANIDHNRGTISMGGFCSGGSGLNNVLIDIDRVNTKEGFKEIAEYMLLSIESFIGVESEWGGPFNRINVMDHVSHRESVVADYLISPSNLERMVDTLLEEPKRFLKFTWDGSKFRVTLLEEANLIDTYPNTLLLSPHERLPNGKTRKLGEDILNVSELNLDDWNFKDTYICKVLDYESSIIKINKENEKEKHYISHRFSKKIEQKLEERINKEYSTRYARTILNEWKAQTENYRRSPLTDKTTLS